MAPVKKRKRKLSSGIRTATPPEDLIEHSRRKEILMSFQTALELSKSGDKSASDKLLPISCIKKPLKKLQLPGVATHEVKRYFGDDSLETLDVDMFLRFAAEKSMQIEKSNRAFELMDKAKKGVVVFEDLQRVCVELGEEISEEELVEMIEFADSSGEGLLSPKHFFRIARKTNL